MNIKRIAVLIPLVFTLVLSCVSVSSVFAISSEQYHDSSELEYDYYLDKPFELRDLIYDYCDSHSTYTGGSSWNDSYYFVTWFMEHGEYDDFCNNEPYMLEANLYTFASPTVMNETDDYIVYNGATLTTRIIFYCNNGNVSIQYATCSFSGAFWYNKSTAYWSAPGYEWYNYSDVQNTSFDPYNNFSDHIFFQDTNIEGFPLYDLYGSHSLDLSVSFSPSLSGTVNTLVSYNGQSYSNGNMIQMHFNNNSSVNVQYATFIVNSGYDVLSLVSSNPYPDRFSSFDSNIRFVLLHEAWQSLLSDDGMHTYANGYSMWQNSVPNSSNPTLISWSQMDLKRNTSYDVVVLVIPDTDEYVPASDQPGYSSASGTVYELYRSTFTLNNNSGFNPTDNSHGNIAYSTGMSLIPDTFSQVQHDGQTYTGSYSREDILSHAVYDQLSSGSYNNSSVSSDLNSLTANFSSFFSFINRVFSFFPRPYQSLLTAGLTSLLVLGIIKVVLK